MFLLQVLLNGISLGIIYAIVALGMTVIFGVMGILNFAHAAMLMLGGFCVYYSTVGLFHFSYFIGLIISFTLTGLFGVFYERVLLRRFNKDILVCLIITLALTKILQGSAQSIFGLEPKAIQPIFGTTLQLSGVYISSDRLFIVIAGMIFILATLFLIDYTKIGTAIRAVSIDSEASLLQGVRIGRIYSFGMFITCGLGGIAGTLISLITPIDAYMGESHIINCFNVMILGGLGSIPGAILAGLLLGTLESFITSYFGTIFAGIVNFSILVVVLIVRPRGLLGEKI